MVINVLVDCVVIALSMSMGGRDDPDVMTGMRGE